MSESDLTHCIDEIRQEISLYWTFVYGSLALTVVSLFVRRHLRKIEASHPSYQNYSRFFLGIGVLKVLLGILLITILLPVCPNDCTCSAIQIGHFTYGYLALGLGIFWLYQGHHFHKKAEQAAEFTSGDGIVMSQPEVATTTKVNYEDKENELV